MARTTEKIEALTTSDIPASKMSLEEIQREIAEVELQTARLGLEAQKKTNADFVEKERRRREANQKRMDELAVARNNYYAQIRECRHRAGGNPKSHLRGGSGANAFSVLTRNIMPDSVTILVTCGRCFLKMYTPVEGHRQLWFKSLKEEQEYFDKLVETSETQGCSENNVGRGPTFMFKNAQGVPIIPARV